MKFGVQPSKNKSGKSSAGNQAMTLVELMITTAIFCLSMMACLYVHLFGLRQDELVESKLGASDQARKDFNQITGDIHAAKKWQVGNYSGGTFTAIGYGTNQQGNALQVSFTNNFNSCIQYFFTTVGGDNQLCRIHTGDAASTVIASNLTGTLSFTAENQTGAMQTDMQWRYVMHFILQFQQYQYPLTTVGTNSLYDFYKMEFRVTPRAPD